MLGSRDAPRSPTGWHTWGPISRIMCPRCGDQGCFEWLECTAERPEFGQSRVRRSHRACGYYLSVPIDYWSYGRGS